MATRLLAPGYQQSDANGNPVSGARLFTYEAGTSTPKPTFSDAGLTIANANPVVANAGGVFGPVFATTGDYKLEMQTPAGVVLWTADPVDGATTQQTVTLNDQVEPVIFNSTFTVWQRGTTVVIPASSSTVASIYGPDGWAMETGVGQACTISRQAGLTTDSQYCMRIQRDAGQTGIPALFPQQWIPTATLSQLRGKTLTCGVDLRAGANFAGTLQVVMYTGTGPEGRRPRTGSYTGDLITINSGFIPITTTAQRFTFTSNAIPSNVTQACLTFRWVPSGTAGAADYFEAGRPILAASPGIDPPPITEMYELQRAQRWYSLPRSHFRGRNDSPGLTPTYTTPMYFPVTMRATPIVTAGTTVTSSSVSSRNASNGTPTGCSVDLVSTAGPSNPIDITDWIADARL
jgi:hypothetical protein